MSKKKPQEQRIQEILEAAIRCFALNGYDKTKMEDIVRESGLTKGGIYFYFKSKRDIFLALLDRHIMEDNLKWTEMLRSSKSEDDLLLRGGQEAFREHMENPWIIPLFQEITTEAFRDEIIRKKVYSFLDGEISMLEAVMTIAVSAKERSKTDFRNLAATIIALAYGLGIFYHLSGKSLPSEKIWNEFLDRMLAGMPIQKNKMSKGEKS